MAAIIGTAFWLSRPLPPPPEYAAPIANPARPEEVPVPGSAADSEVPRSPLADDLGSPRGDGRQDAAIVFNVLSYFRSRFGGFPSAEDNAGFLSALAGRNPGRLELISRSHPSVNRKGELLDRWGTPFFFHLVSSQTMEVRSAGPDREMYTMDDVVAGNRRNPEHEGASDPQE